MTDPQRDTDAWLFRRVAAQVAVGGVLVIVRLPLLGRLGPILGMVLVVLALGHLHARLTDPSARRRVERAFLLALAVGLLTGALVLVEFTTWPEQPLPAWLPVAVTGQVTLGVIGTLLLTTAAGRAAEVRGWTEAARAWSRASLAVAAVHGPIATVVVLASAAGRPAEVSGAPAVALFALAVVPYATIAWAGSRSGRIAAAGQPA